MSNKPIEYQPLKAKGNYYRNLILLPEGYLKPKWQIILGEGNSVACDSIQFFQL